MVVIMLCIKADLENVESFSVPREHIWCLDVKQSSGEEMRERITVNPLDEFEMAGSRGTCNFVVRWGGKSQSSMNVQHIKGVTRDYTADDSGKEVPIVAFECRGVEPVVWHPQGGYTVKSTGGKVFQDIEFDNTEWCDYDENKDLSVGIYNLSHSFKVHRS
ncbi:unnamed protein product [Vitrella brassicaformis CCMP3155]|uniref:Uncharacterized protein n=2 Tax=Vitrella brassicaformis TaxID=1169539 RepID=A0A0G4FS65_VITBC|nr:unnamed protein product [Vitrella brassicaformis CCMP3155]|eukprot:CEM17535.1 unnamed protein product [Vitrella brassicaformis CCMP3155]